MTARAALVALALSLAAGAAGAHEIEATVQSVQATAVTLRYADGTPFAGETFELRAEGGARAVLTGRTDASGRAVFVPDGPGPWRLRAMSDDGHGVDRLIDGPLAQAASAPGAPAGPDRSSRVVLGLGLVLGGFGALQLVLRRRKAD